MKRILYGVLLLVFFAQTLYLANRIIQSERTLENGNVYRFQTVPVDPYDAFRGRYVRLHFALENTAHPLDSASCFGWSSERMRWASLVRDEHNVAQIGGLYKEKPAQGDAIQVKLISCVEDDKGQINLTFDKFYANELLAPEIEQRFREHAEESYLHLRVRGRYAVPEKLEIAEGGAGA
ncbi:GDYXXLXY domain-containing protein [Suttonella sp. R2A3]|uniref:GDYXXLXY domain-containing protein n=1 Tax=Suttonella sp. R2A3 TaxID=2908648 RepID=UPI001F3113EB|nr:GDYXXLXY domain-containing protein [Suttonella sp. R2A3]UJF23819.1 GDYXXLXY domain-containing protein [Suttonella sp. R2A3]